MNGRAKSSPSTKTATNRRPQLAYGGMVGSAPANGSLTPTEYEASDTRGRRRNLSSAGSACRREHQPGQDRGRAGELEWRRRLVDEHGREGDRRDGLKGEQDRGHD